VVHSDHAFATVAYLQIKDAILEDKPQSISIAPTIPLLLEEVATELELSVAERKERSSLEARRLAEGIVRYPSVDTQVVRQNEWLFVPNVQCNFLSRGTPIEDEVISCFDMIKCELSASGC
jgi:diphthine-ammonia ligase